MARSISNDSVIIPGQLPYGTGVGEKGAGPCPTCTCSGRKSIPTLEESRGTISLKEKNLVTLLGDFMQSFVIVPAEFFSSIFLGEENLEHKHEHHKPSAKTEGKKESSSKELSESTSFFSTISDLFSPEEETEAEGSSCADEECRDCKTEEDESPLATFQKDGVW